jgi:hypothetical protein
VALRDAGPRLRHRRRPQLCKRQEKSQFISKWLVGDRAPRTNETESQ